MAADGTSGAGGRGGSRRRCGRGQARAAATAAGTRPSGARSGRWWTGRKALFAWWQHTRPARANARFGARGGGVLTGGIAYAALFSVFAALTIGYTVFMAVLGDNDELRQEVLDAVNASLPGLDRHRRRRSGMIDPDALVLSGGLTVDRDRRGRRAAAQRDRGDGGPAPVGPGDVRRRGAGGNPVLGKARELGGFVGMAFAVLLSAVLTTASATVGVVAPRRPRLGRPRRRSSCGWSASWSRSSSTPRIFLLVVTVLAGGAPGLAGPAAGARSIAARHRGRADPRHDGRRRAA